MLYIFGAGAMGEKYAQLLRENKVEINGFIDTYKKGEITVGENLYPIVPIEQVGSEDIIVVSILDIKTREDIIKNIEEKGLCHKDIAELLYCENEDEEKKRRLIGDYHFTQMDDYFESAESNENTGIFWDQSSLFKKMFNKLDTEICVEIACGRGRHVPFYINNCKQVILVDIQRNNIELCKKRFSEYNIIKYYCNNGQDLKEIVDESVTCVFSYDSMVHFEMIDIYSYLKEMRRILKQNGMALIHHSNNTEDYRIDFTTGKNGRNYMSADLFAYLAHRAGLKVVEQHIIDWANCKNLDCITLLQKDE